MEAGEVEELRMMAEGRFASLPRSLHAAPGPAQPARQPSLASSMDLLSSRPAHSHAPHQPPPGYHALSIHGTLPRRRRGGVAGPAPPLRPWDTPLPGPDAAPSSAPSPALHRARLPASPLIHHVIEEHQGYQPAGRTYR